MQNPSPRLKIAALFVLGVSAVVPALAQAPSSGSTVVYAGGDDVVVKSADGKLLNYMVTPDTKLMAEGKQVPVGELKPGEKLTAAIPGTPQVVTAVNVVKGKVYGITPPNGVTLSLPEGVKDLTVPEGTTFMVDGKRLTVSQLKSDMVVEATIVTTGSGTDTTTASATPAQSGALLVAKTATEEDLPAAGTNLPLFGATGMVLLSAGLGLMAWRRKPVRG